MLFLINRMLLLQIYSLFKPHAFASSAASDAAQTLVVGWAPQFRGCRRGFRANHSQVRQPLRAVCVYRRRPASMPGHGGADGVMLPLRLCVRGLGSCAPGGDVRGRQEVWVDGF